MGYLGLGMAAIASLAVILAIILSGLKFRGGAAPAMAGNASAAEDYDPLEDDDDL